MPPPKDMDILLKVKQVDAMITPRPPHIPVIVLEIEDGRTFTLYGVPYEIVLAINRIRQPGAEFIGERRESLYDILLQFREQVEGSIGKLLSRVIIDKLDYSTGLYSATAEFMLGGIVMRREMIPSHAIFMAMLFDKPIYVRKKLVDEQEEFESEQSEGGEDEFL